MSRRTNAWAFEPGVDIGFKRDMRWQMTGTKNSSPSVQAGDRPQQPTDVVARRATDRVQRVTERALSQQRSIRWSDCVWPINGSMA